MEELVSTGPALETFFADYARRTNDALSGNLDVEATAGALAGCFIGAGPTGVRCSPNDEELRSVIPQGIEFYRSMGTVSMNVRATEITPLDDHHDMVRVFWTSDYKKDGGTVTIDFEVIYLLEDTSGTPKIFGYITGDEQKAYRDHGLIQ